MALNKNPNDCVSRTCVSILSVSMLYSGLFSASVLAAGESTMVPDFNGIYMHRHSKASRGGEGNYLNEARPTTEAKAIMDEYDPAEDFVIQCEPPGLKRQLLHPYPMTIAQNRDTLDFWYEGWEAERTVHLRGEFPGVIEPSKLGYSVGHFEGEDLVIETIGLSGGFISEVSGLQFSEDARFTERYTRFDDDDDNHIALHLTIEDPRRLEEPMLISDAWTWDPSVVLLDYDCLIPEHHGLGR
jgi:hypothetical protein